MKLAKREITTLLIPTLNDSDAEGLPHVDVGNVHDPELGMRFWFGLWLNEMASSKKKAHLKKPVAKAKAKPKPKAAPKAKAKRPAPKVKASAADDKAEAFRYGAAEIRNAVLGGFVARAGMKRLITNLVDRDAALRKKLLRQVEIERTAARKRPRPEPCINDGIDRAFAALEAEHRIVALQNAGLTQSEAWEDLHAVAASWRENGIKPVGACFYHGQDLESAVAGKGLSLGFGAFGPANHDKSVRVGTTIIDVLRAHGVPTKWDGDPEESIWIEPFIWWRPT